MNAHGWLIIDKPLGWTSADVLRYLKPHFEKKTKLGHAGTLDPLATGVLPVAYGQATKAIEYLAPHDKIYQFCVRFGLSTTTDDHEGKIVEVCQEQPSQEALETILPKFLGAVSQVPPLFCAVKIQGKRAYALARAGQTPTLPARSVFIKSLRFLHWVRPYIEACFEVKCGSGTYVRALARDMAKALNTCGYVTQLRRMAVGPFRQEDALLPQSIGTPPEMDILKKKFPFEVIFDRSNLLEVSSQQAGWLTQGRVVHMKGEGDEMPTSQVLAMCQNKPIAFISREGDYVKPLKVLNF